MVTEMSMLNVESRRDMSEAYSLRMNENADKFDEEGKYEYEYGAIKTFMFDTNIEGRRTNEEDIIKWYLDKVAENTRIKTTKLRDDNFFRVERISQGKINVFFIDADASYGRFWLIHTDALKDAADEFHTALTRLSDIDNAWFPRQLLRRAGRKGVIKGFTSKYDNVVLAKQERDNERATRPRLRHSYLTGQQGLFSNEIQELADALGEAELRDYLTIQMWGNRSSMFLQALDALSVISPQDYTNSPLSVQRLLDKLNLIYEYIPVSGVRVRYSIDGDYSSPLTTTNSLSYTGRVTAYGRSFDSHQQFSASTLIDYRKLVNTIEDRFALRYDEDGFHGSAITVEFNQDLPYSIADFVGSIFDSAEPFRLWGLPIEYETSYAKINAVDLHIGQGIIFEVFPDRVKMNITEGTCGNTIARFYTLIQKAYRRAQIHSDGTSIYEDDNEQII